MSKANKKKGSVFSVLLVIVLLLVVGVTVCANVIFSEGRVPMVAGYYLYLHETADMEPDIAENSLVLAKAAEQTSLQPGSKVLCYLSDGNMALRCIYQINVNEDGSTSYFPGTALEQGSELAIERSNIFAECVWYSKELYTVVKFATSVMGLMVMLVVPCIILIIMLLFKIARSSRDDLDEEDLEEETPVVPAKFGADDFEDEPVSRKRRKKSDEPPLFNPDQPTAQDDTLEKKKASIQENFSEKPVNEDSPYQKAVQERERTMKFKKIEQEDIERAKEEAAAKEVTSPAEQPKPVETETTYAGTPDATAFQPGAPDAAEPQEKKPYVPTHGMDTPIIPTEDTAPRTAAPNIDDIIDPGQLRAAKEGKRYNADIASTGSIDDLIAALEKEKNKL